MGTLALGTMLIGGLLQANAAHQQGVEAESNATINAAQLNIAAGQEKGIGQRKSAEVRRQNRLLQSRQVALNAAGGGSSSDKNVADLLADTAAQGEYDSLNALYEGDTRSQGTANKAARVYTEGRNARKASKTNVLSSLVNTGSNIGTFYSKYGTSAPSSQSGNSYQSSSLDF